MSVKETVSIRLEPKTKYGMELLSRKQYRSLNGVFSYIINDAIKKELDDLVEKVWDMDEAKRLQNLRTHAPHLLTYEELHRKEKA